MIRSTSLVAVVVAALLLQTCFVAFAYKITPITNYKKGRADVANFPLTLGEGPHWDAVKQQLYLVDIFENTVYRYDPATQFLYSVRVDGTVTPVVPIRDSTDRFILGVGREFKVMQWDGVSGTPRNLTSVGRVDEPSSHRFNDGKCDPRGRLFAGTMDESNDGNPSGGLYRLDANGGVTQWENGIATSNGLAWSLDHTTFYYIDTPTVKVDAFDYDVNTGDIRNRRTIFDFRANGIGRGVPDGMTIDSDGNLWVCMWDGGAVHKINPRTGTLLQTVDFQGLAMLTTSAAFGGPNLDKLYVTSSKWDNSEYGGYLFEVTELGGARGVPGGGVSFVANF